MSFFFFLSKSAVNSLNEKSLLFEGSKSLSFQDPISVIILFSYPHFSKSTMGNHRAADLEASLFLPNLL